MTSILGNQKVTLKKLGIVEELSPYYQTMGLFGKVKHKKYPPEGTFESMIFRLSQVGYGLLVP